MCLSVGRRGGGGGGGGGGRSSVEVRSFLCFVPT